MTVLDIAKGAKHASSELLTCTEDDRQGALLKLAKLLRGNAQSILQENAKDVELALEAGLRAALVDRLKLNATTIESMASGVEQIAQQDEVVGEIIETREREDGLKIQKQRIPLGVIAMAFESRPNVVIDCSALAIKSGNAIVLKGGKEALYSNRVLCELVQKACEGFLPTNSVHLVEARDELAELLKLKDFIDVMIPRGSEKFIEFVYANASMPVIAHFAGLCHGYVHSDADLDKALEICVNAKAQRVSVCNAIETLLLHKDLPRSFKESLFSRMKDAGIELRVSENLQDIQEGTTLANEADWRTEYLDYVLSVKEVSGVGEAIEHIQAYGTKHTEFICAKDKNVILRFLNSIDSSCIMVNASTRFNDGAELGLGAELGISTSKLHAYGPMGAREMTTSRFLVAGDGHVRN